MGVGGYAHMSAGLVEDSKGHWISLELKLLAVVNCLTCGPGNGLQSSGEGVCALNCCAISSAPKIGSFYSQFL